jgi:hypothetical protein
MQLLKQLKLSMMFKVELSLSNFFGMNEFSKLVPLMKVPCIQCIATLIGTGRCQKTAIPVENIQANWMEPMAEWLARHDKAILMPGCLVCII